MRFLTLLWLMHKVLTNNFFKSIAKLYVSSKGEIMFDKKVFVEILKIFKEYPNV